MPDSANIDIDQKPTSRRKILFWLAITWSGMAGLGASIGSKFLAYLSKPPIGGSEQFEYLVESGHNLQSELLLKEQKLQRMENTKTAIADLSDLHEGTGKLFTDYFLMPAVLFKTSSQTAIARSAVCTHLGCTVQTQLVDDKIYCSCHASYFDLESGNPLSGPAEDPLAQEPIVIEGNTVYMVKPGQPIKIGPSQKPMQPL